MDELERFKIRMIGEEHNRRRREEAQHADGWGPIVMLSTLCALLKTWLIR